MSRIVVVKFLSSRYDVVRARWQEVKALDRAPVPAMFMESDLMHAKGDGAPLTLVYNFDPTEPSLLVVVAW